jgi:hypothetical protein
MLIDKQVAGIFAPEPLIGPMVRFEARLRALGVSNAAPVSCGDEFRNSRRVVAPGGAGDVGLVEGLHGIPVRS